MGIINELYYHDRQTLVPSPEVFSLLHEESLFPLSLLRVIPPQTTVLRDHHISHFRRGWWGIDCIYKSRLLGSITSFSDLVWRLYSGLSVLLWFGDEDGVCVCVSGIFVMSLTHTDLSIEIKWRLSPLLTNTFGVLG